MPKFKIGDRVQMPGVPLVVTVEALDTCDDDGCNEEMLKFTDPGGQGEDWMHASEFEKVAS